MQPTEMGRRYGVLQHRDMTVQNSSTKPNTCEGERRAPKMTATRAPRKTEHTHFARPGTLMVWYTFARGTLKVRSRYAQGSVLVRSRYVAGTVRYFNFFLTGTVLRAKVVEPSCGCVV